MKLIHLITAFVLSVLFNAVQILMGSPLRRRVGARPGVKVTQATTTQGFKLEVSVDAGTTWVEVKGITDIPDPTG